MNTIEAKLPLCCVAVLILGSLALRCSNPLSSDDALPGGESTAEEREPEILIVTPSGTGSFSTCSSYTALHGFAFDNGSVVSVTWSTSTGDSGAAQGTAEWSIDSIPLQAGDNRVVVRATDNIGSYSEASVMIVYNRSIRISYSLRVFPSEFTAGTAAVCSAVAAIDNTPGVVVDSIALFAVDSSGQSTGASLASLDTSSQPAMVKQGSAYIGAFTVDIPTDSVIAVRAAIYFHDSVSAGIEYSETDTITVTEPVPAGALDTIASMPQWVHDQYDTIVAAGNGDAAAQHLLAWLDGLEFVEDAEISGTGNMVWYLLRGSGAMGAIVLEWDEDTAAADTSATPYNTTGLLDSLMQGLPRAQGLTKTAVATDDVSPGNYTTLNGEDGAERKAIVLSPFYFEFGYFKDPGMTLGSSLESIRAGGTKRIYDKGPDNKFLYQNEEVTIQLFKTLDQYDVVNLSTHGGVWAKYDAPFVLSGEEATGAAIAANATDLSRRTGEPYPRIAQFICPANKKEYLAVSALFFNAYYRSPGSVMHLGACHSQYKSRQNGKRSIPFILLAKGAWIVSGYEGKVALYHDKNVPELYWGMLLQGSTVQSAAGFVTSMYPTDGTNGSGSRFLFQHNSTDHLVTVLPVFGIHNGSFERVCSVEKDWMTQSDVNSNVPMWEGQSPKHGDYMGIIAYNDPAEQIYGDGFGQTFWMTKESKNIVFSYNMIRHGAFSPVEEAVFGVYLVPPAGTGGRVTMLEVPLETVELPAWKTVTYSVSGMVKGMSIPGAFGMPSTYASFVFGIDFEITSSLTPDASIDILIDGVRIE